jgi:hypothetical protein
VGTGDSGKKSGIVSRSGVVVGVGTDREEEMTLGNTELTLGKEDFFGANDTILDLQISKLQWKLMMEIVFKTYRLEDLQFSASTRPLCLLFSPDLFFNLELFRLVGGKVILFKSAERLCRVLVVVSVLSSCNPIFCSHFLNTSKQYFSVH